MKNYVRRCPTCATENAAEVMRCACGALLAGVDLVLPRATTAVAPTPAPTSTSASTNRAPDQAETSPKRICVWEDCAQPNPGDAETCLYCNRPLTVAPAVASAQTATLVTLPGILRADWKVLEVLPAKGAEAELLLVQPLNGGETLMAKVYRSGIRPRAEVQERIANIPIAHRVDIRATGVDDGHAWELMEYCHEGSLRDALSAGTLGATHLRTLLQELAESLRVVHEVGLLHRDLKPENVLIRSLHPLDVVLTDFGIASLLNATQLFTGAARTLPYAAPESLSGVIDAKSDYWSLGMILLEVASGAHPFDGLSEAVILHHLTTRSIDLSEIHDNALHKLLHGLLQRDPQCRWGSAEIARWLADDPTLPPPAVSATAVSLHEAYHLCEDICHTKEQLGVSLSRHWREGVADIGSGQLLAWLREVQRDQNAVRLLLDSRHDRKQTVDMQLLNLIIYLAPGIPPVWRGESIELRAILQRASQALKGEVAAQDWLDKLHRQRVLEVWANAGNAQAAEIFNRWTVAMDEFVSAWSTGMETIRANQHGSGDDHVVNYDDVVYGRSGPNGPQLDTVHARLLALAYDPNWLPHLRKRLSAEYAAVCAWCPWFAALGDPLNLSGAGLLAMEALLPQARKAVEVQMQAQVRRREQARDELRHAHAHLGAVVDELGRLAAHTWAWDLECVELQQCVQNYSTLLEKFRASARPEADWQMLRKAAIRLEPTVNALDAQVAKLREQHAATSGFVDLRAVIFALMALLFVPATLGPRWLPWILGAFVALFLWRAVPTLLMMNEVRASGQRILRATIPDLSAGQPQIAQDVTPGTSAGAT